MPKKSKVKKVKTSKTSKTVKAAKKTPKKTPKKTIKKSTAVVATPVQAEVVATVAPTPVVKTEAEKIWDEIKDLKIEMFALPSQFVWQHCTALPFDVDPNRLFLTTRSTATLPSLEASLDSFTKDTKQAVAEFAKRGHVLEVKEYKVELVDKYVVVSRAVPQLPAILLKK
jgi:hypothetical protein